MMEKENIDNFIEIIREISVDTQDFINNLNFILKRLGEMYNETK